MTHLHSVPVCSVTSSRGRVIFDYYALQSRRRHFSLRVTASCEARLIHPPCSHACSRQVPRVHRNTLPRVLCARRVASSFFVADLVQHCAGLVLGLEDSTALPHELM